MLEAPVDVEELYDEVCNKPQKDIHFDMWRAKQLPPKQRGAVAKALLAGKAEISAMRRDEEKRTLKRQLTSGIVYHVGTTGSKLVYPHDFPELPRKKGKTWDPKRKDINPIFADYVDMKMHFEKVLVLWGSAGIQKTPTAAAIANHLAENYNVGRYCKASSPDALKPAQPYFDKYVPVILEELSAADVSQHGRKMSPNYLKQLFEIRDGGQCRVRNTNACFHPLQPKIVCINDKPADWLRAVDGITGADDEPLKKRLFFVHVDEPVIAPVAVAAHEADLDAIVAQGKRRRLELQSDRASESDFTPTTAASGGLEAGESIDSDHSRADGKNLDLSTSSAWGRSDGGSVQSEEESSIEVAQPMAPGSGVLKDLAAHVHASCVDTAFKLYKEDSTEHRKASEIALQPEVKAIRECKAFQEHHRCEANYGLDAGALSLLEKALPHDDQIRMKMGLAKAIVCPQDGMIQQLEKGYHKYCGRNLWDDSTFSPEAMYRALKRMDLDNAYGGMRRSFFTLEARRQQAHPGPLKISKKDGRKQKSLFANYWAHLLEAGAFAEAWSQFAGKDTDIHNILEKTLFVKTTFHRMLVAREFGCLIDKFPRNGGERVVSVGGGAARIVREYAGKEYAKGKTYDQTELQADLSKLHEALLQELDSDFVEMICPRGWRLDFTEHACCEFRRYQDAVVAVAAGRSPKRKRDEAAAAQRQGVRCRRLRMCWRALGFKSLPSRAE